MKTDEPSSDVEKQSSPWDEVFLRTIAEMKKWKARRIERFLYPEENEEAPPGDAPKP